MALTQTQIANMALARLKQETIETWGESSTQGALASAMWAPARLVCLELRSWTFATKYQLISANDAVEPYDYQYEFDLPADYVRTVELIPTVRHQPIQHKRRGWNIYADVENIHLAYIYDHDNPGQWSPLFCSVVAWRLAAEMAPSLQDTAFDRNQCLQFLQVELQTAAIADAGNGYQESTTGNSWDDAR